MLVVCREVCGPLRSLHLNFGGSRHLVTDRKSAGMATKILVACRERPEHQGLQQHDGRMAVRGML